MVKDTYRRPRRTYSSDESDAEKFNRYSLRRGPGKPLETLYSKGEKSSQLRQRKFETKYKLGQMIYRKPESRFKTIYPSAKERKEKEKGLVKKLGVVSVALIAGSALFLTPNFTGNVIWGLTSGKTNMLGAVFFIWGLAGLLFVLKQK